MSEYQKLPSYVLDISEFCQDHNERFQFYCRKDECQCCEICIVENHNECKDIAILKDMVKNVKTSVQLNEVEQLIHELKKTVDKIRKDREKNLVDVSEQTRIVECEIRELRTKINNHLDKLQEDLMKELTEEETKITRKTRELLSSLDQNEKDLTEYQTNIVSIRQYASDLQTFLAMKQLETDIETHDTSLHALVNSDNLNQTKLSCRIDTRLKNIITSIEKFGEVVVESKPCELSFVRRKINKPR
jgi:chromosome segregation ATPase